MDKKLSVDLTDHVIILKLFKLEDAEAHVAGEDADQQKWLSGGKSTIETTRAWILKNKASWENGGPVFCFSIWTKEGNLSGMVEANLETEQIKTMNESGANISYGLYPQARGNGYAIRAVNLMLDFLKQKGIKRAWILVEPENKNSLKVPIRCGFQKQNIFTNKKGEQFQVFLRELS